MLVFSGLLGGALGPFVVGLFSDLATSGQDARLRCGLSFMLLVPVLSTIALLVALRQLSAKQTRDEGNGN